jgi:putative transposase
VTAPSSIDPARFLHDQLASASPDLLRQTLTTFVNTLMSAEADVICGAPYGMPSPERVNVRNGYRHRDFDTRAGTLDVAIPRLRSGTYFPDWLLERRRRAEAALTSVVATCYLLGVSTRRMEKLVESLGITRLSRSQVSEMARDLDDQVEAFRTRPLDAGPYTFAAADALVLKVREGGRVVNVHALLATGVNADGHREILGLQVTSAEDGAGWLVFFRDLTARGLTGVALVTSDAHRGLTDAIGATLPGASWQRCRTHYAANLMSVTPKASLAMGQDAAALGLRPARRRVRARPVRPAGGRRAGQAASGGRAPGRRPRRRARVHWLPEGDLAPDLVQQPAGTAQPGDPPPHRRRRHLPRPRLPHPPRRRRPGRTARRMGRRPPLPRPRRPGPIPHQSRPHRYGGDPRQQPPGAQRLTPAKGSCANPGTPRPRT